MIRLTTTVTLFVVAALGLGCATGARRGDDGGVRARGALAVQGPEVRALAAGPSVLHVYAQTSGAQLYFAPARTGTDEDCAGALLAGAPRSVVVNRRNTLLVPSGSVGCVAVGGARGLELLWHAHPSAEPGGAGAGEAVVAAAP
jgi:hypothetical protein